MPIYEYKCRVCDEHFEVEQSFTDESLTEMDGCSIHDSGRHQVKKVFVAPAIAFKGDGFYRNDARASTASSTKSDDSRSSEKSGDTSSESSTDSASTSDSSTAKPSAAPSTTPSSGEKATSPSTAASTSKD